MPLTRVVLWLGPKFFRECNVQASHFIKQSVQRLTNFIKNIFLTINAHFPLLHRIVIETEKLQIRKNILQILSLTPTSRPQFLIDSLKVVNLISKDPYRTMIQMTCTYPVYSPNLLRQYLVFNMVVTIVYPQRLYVANKPCFLLN